MPHTVVINESTAMSDADIQKMLPAFQQQWNADLKSAWQVEHASFHFLPQRKAPATASWWLVFLDNSDQASALAYHDLTNDGYPVAKVFVKTLLTQGASVSLAASHELCEMAVDPWLNAAYQDAAARSGPPRFATPSRANNTAIRSATSWSAISSRRIGTRTDMARPIWISKAMPTARSKCWPAAMRRNSMRYRAGCKSPAAPSRKPRPTRPPVRGVNAARASRSKTCTAATWPGTAIKAATQTATRQRQSCRCCASGPGPTVAI